MKNVYKHRKTQYICALLTPLTLFMHQSTYAGGFQLSDHSITALGRSQAGYGIVGDDASAAFFNPAGLSLLDKKHIQVGVAFIKAEGHFTNNGSTDANIGTDRDGAQDSATPSIYYVTPINQQLHFGLAINSPFGTHTHYDEDFVGQYSGLKTKIITININPSIAYKINNFVSVGAGISYQKMDATISAAGIPLAPNSTLTIEGDSDQWGYNVGAMFSFADDSRLGISYRSKIEHDIKGNAIFSGFGAADGSFAATADFISPETTYLAYAKPLSDKWLLSLGYRWTRWSRFEALDVQFPTGLASKNSTISTQWSDVKTIALGADYKLNDQWTLRAGYAQDDSPVPDFTRSVRTVDSDRTWYSIGASYHANQHIQWDVAYRYIAFDNAPVSQDITRSNGTVALGTLNGDFSDINIHTLAFQINYQY
jgi:long-chain fatty acid transport protein